MDLTNPSLPCSIGVARDERNRLARAATDTEETEQTMINWYAVETEADFRRFEWEREAAAASRIAEADRGARAKRFGFHPQDALVSLRSLLSARLAPAPEPCPTVPC